MHVLGIVRLPASKPKGMPALTCTPWQNPLYRGEWRFVTGKPGSRAAQDSVASVDSSCLARLPLLTSISVLRGSQPPRAPGSADILGLQRATDRLPPLHPCHGSRAAVRAAHPEFVSRHGQHPAGGPVPFGCPAADPVGPTLGELAFQPASRQPMLPAVTGCGLAMRNQVIADGSATVAGLQGFIMTCARQNFAL
jgi:hypothetical protein